MANMRKRRPPVIATCFSEILSAIIRPPITAKPRYTHTHTHTHTHTVTDTDTDTGTDTDTDTHRQTHRHTQKFRFDGTKILVRYTDDSMHSVTRVKPVHIEWPSTPPDVTPYGSLCAANAMVAICDRSPHSARKVSTNACQRIPYFVMKF